jgi:hypothetical protein
MTKLVCGVLVAMGSLLLGAGCQTQFYGDPAFPGGAPACFEKCRRQNMEMASFVYVGEYSTACACKPRGASARALPEGDQAAIVAAAAGVELQRRRMEQERAAAVSATTK